MRIVSFAWTTEAIRARAKSVTRRQWVDRYAKSFKAGELLQAWDKVPFAGGKRIGTIRLTRAPYKQAWRDMPDSEWEREGFAYLSGLDGVSLPHIPLTWGDFQRWRDRDGEAWVIEFETLEVGSERD